MLKSFRVYFFVSCLSETCWVDLFTILRVVIKSNETFTWDRDLRWASETSDFFFTFNNCLPVFIFASSKLSSVSCQGSLFSRWRAWKRNEKMLFIFLFIYSFIYFTHSDDCTVRPHKQKCEVMLRCRQRCSNEYPVPNGFKECTGKFEGDTCEIGCPRGFQLIGDEIVQCRNGEWVKENGQDASSSCESLK